MAQLKLHGDGAPLACRRLTGRLPSGGRYVIDVSAAWKGVLLVYSVGYITGPPGQPRSAMFENARSSSQKGQGRLKH
jgi:hypothetical protein